MEYICMPWDTGRLVNPSHCLVFAGRCRHTLRFQYPYRRGEWPQRDGGQCFHWFRGVLRRQLLVTPPLSWASSFLFKTWCKCSPKFVKFHMAMRLPNHILLPNKVDVSDGHTIFDTFISTTPICRNPWQKAWQVFGGSGPPHVVVNVYELPKFM